MAKLNPIPRPNPPTVAEAARLLAAAQRQDGAIIWPARLKGKAASALGASLIEKGLAREMRAKPGLPAWRQDVETGKSYALLLTKAGRAAAPAPEADTAMAGQDAGAGLTQPSQPTQVSDRPQRSEAQASDAASGQAAGDGSITGRDDQLIASPVLPASAPRPDSKISTVIGLLERETGATITELTTATGWLPHTTRAALTGLRKRGFAVTTERQQGAPTTYRIQPAPALQAA